MKVKKNMASQQDTTKQLIALVRARRSLWDGRQQNIPGIKKRQIEEWVEIAAIHGSSVAETKKKWKSLRASFTKIEKRTQNKAVNPSSWPFFQDMIFLRERYEALPRIKIEKRRSDDSLATTTKSKRQRATSEATSDATDVVSNVAQMDGDSSSELIISNDEDNDPHLYNITETVENDASVFEQSFDSDYMFLMSMLEFLRQLPNNRKLLIRGAISCAIAEIIANENGASQ